MIEQVKNMYGRLADSEGMAEIVRDAQEQGCDVEKDDDAGVIDASYNGETTFSAMQKDDNTWLVMYNPLFYPKPE